MNNLVLSILAGGLLVAVILTAVTFRNGRRVRSTQPTATPPTPPAAPQTAAPTPPTPKTSWMRVLLWIAVPTILISSILAAIWFWRDDPENLTIILAITALIALILLLWTAGGRRFTQRVLGAVLLIVSLTLPVILFVVNIDVTTVKELILEVKGGWESQAMLLAGILMVFMTPILAGLLAALGGWNINPPPSHISNTSAYSQTSLKWGLSLGVIALVLTIATQPWADFLPEPPERKSSQQEIAQAADPGCPFLSDAGHAAMDFRLEKGERWSMDRCFTIRAKDVKSKALFWHNGRNSWDPVPITCYVPAEQKGEAITELRRKGGITNVVVWEHANPWNANASYMRPNIGQNADASAWSFFNQSASTEDLAVRILCRPK
jgi:hypothetical protein